MISLAPSNTIQCASRALCVDTCHHAGVRASSVCTTSPYPTAFPTLFPCAYWHGLGYRKWPSMWVCPANSLEQRMIEFKLGKDRIGRTRIGVTDPPEEWNCQLSHRGLPHLLDDDWTANQNIETGNGFCDIQLTRRTYRKVLETTDENPHNVTRTKQLSGVDLKKWIHLKRGFPFPKFVIRIASICKHSWTASRVLEFFQ